MPGRVSTNGSAAKRTKTTTMSKKKPNATAKSQYGYGIVRIPYNATFRRGPFPPKYYATLRYADQASIALSSAAAGGGQYLFSCNNLYDPNISGTGHQPMYYDQLSAIYNHWTVISSKITIQPMLNSIPADPIQLALFQDDDTTTGTIANINTAIERNNATSAMCIPAQGSFPVMTKTWSAKQWFGLNPLANDNLQGSVSTPPVEQVYYIIQAQDPTGADGSILMRVYMEFNVVWDELVSMAPS